MKTGFLKKGIWMVLLVFILTAVTTAQSGRGKGRLQGIITDQNGEPVINAKVVLEFKGDDKVVFETTSNKNGEWGMMGLGTGVWRVTVSLEGYQGTYSELYVQQLERNPKLEMTLTKLAGGSTGVIEDEDSLALLESANDYFDQQNYTTAIIMYQEFLEANPKAYQVGISIGDCYLAQGNFDQAIEAYNQVLENATGDTSLEKELAAKALAGIGECYLKQDDFENAQGYFKKSIETYPENELTAYNVGEIFFSNQKLDEAIQYFVLANELKPEWSDPFYKLGLVYLNKGDYANATVQFEKFLELEPDTERAAGVNNILSQIKKQSFNPT